MPDINVDGIVLCFPDGWTVTKFDDWSFYRNQFSRMHDCIKSVDVLAISSGGNELWMIEVKDFRKYKRKKSELLHEEILGKVFASLAALLPAKTNACDNDEKNFAKKALRVSKIHVVFHGEQPKTPSKVFPESYHKADLLKELQRRLKSIDPHALVVSGEEPRGVPWEVKF